jgi:preprotein translocase subunit SecA
LFSDFNQSLEGLSAEELMKVMRSFLSKGVAACQKGFEKATEETKVSLEERRLLENENRLLREENEKLKEQSCQLADQSSKQRTVIDALKQELETSLKCYEECRIELKDMVTQYDAQQVLLEANANLIAELKKMKGELEDTLEKNEAYCHQWGRIWPRHIIVPLRALVLKLMTSRLPTISRASWNGYTTS